MIELLAGIGAALLAGLAILFKLWRRAASQRDEAKRGKAQAEGQLDHAKRTQSASEKARTETEQAVEEVRQEARKGRRDHFEGQ